MDVDDPTSTPSTSTFTRRLEIVSDAVPGTSATQENVTTLRSATTSIFRQKTMTTMFGKISKKSKEDIDKKLLLLFITDFQPFSVVEDAGFKQFVSALNPSYQLPNRHTLSRTTIPALYEETVLKVKDCISQGMKFCITTDCWTSRNTVNYMAVTAHFVSSEFQLCSLLLECCATDFSHTSENLATELRRVVESWGIENKILLAVSDNAANIKNAISTKLSWNHFGCFAHTLNLIVKDALKNKEMSAIIEKVKQIVAHFRKSCVSNEKLMVYQRNAGNEPLKLLQDVATRWNSTFYMLQRFLQLQEAVRSTIAVIEKDLPVITSQEWKILAELCSILKPFENATVTISAESYCTASLVIPIRNGLVNVYSNLLKNSYSMPIRQILPVLLNGLKERLGNIERSNTLIVSTFLDARFKNLAFSDVTAAENTKKIVTEAVSEIYNYEANQQPTEIPDEIEDNTPTELSIWSSFETFVSAHKPRGTSMSRAIIEVQRYLEDDLIPRNSDPLQWWRNNKFKYPKLSLVAQERLCALASSVPCERLFSKAGQVLNERRTRLNEAKTKMLLFLNVNYKYCNN
jgi:hypothetical protein